MNLVTQRFAPAYRIRALTPKIITRLADKLDVLDLARAVGHKDIRQLMTYYNKSAKDLALQLG